jgi:hypothetical protein
MVPRNDGVGVDLGEDNAMELGLGGRKALVTNASRGIGRDLSDSKSVDILATNVPISIC